MSALDELIDMARLAQIESSGNPNAVNPKSGAAGLYQIMPKGGALDDWNNYNNEKYTPKDLLNPEVNTKIAEWYLNKRIPQMLKHYKKPVNLENILTSYNAGIGYVAHDKPRPKETLQYIEKYKGLR